jgi:hypothetical protein
MTGTGRKFGVWSGHKSGLCKIVKKRGTKWERRSKMVTYYLPASQCLGTRASSSQIQLRRGAVISVGSSVSENLPGWREKVGACKMMAVESWTWPLAFLPGGRFGLVASLGALYSHHGGSRLPFPYSRQKEKCQFKMTPNYHTIVVTYPMLNGVVGGSIPSYEVYSLLDKYTTVVRWFGAFFVLKTEPKKGIWDEVIYNSQALRKMVSEWLPFPTTLIIPMLLFGVT